MAQHLQGCKGPFFFFSMRGLPQSVANEATGGSNWMLILTSAPGPTALHPLRRMRCMLSNTNTNTNTYSICRVELSRLPERKKTLYGMMAGLEPATLGLQTNILTTRPPTTPHVGGGLLQSFDDFCPSVCLSVCPSVSLSQPPCVHW